MFATLQAERLRVEVGDDRAAFGFAGVPAAIADGGKLMLTIQCTDATLGNQRWVDLLVAAGAPEG
jgi:hypothetical protein